MKGASVNLKHIICCFVEVDVILSWKCVKWWSFLRLNKFWDSVPWECFLQSSCCRCNYNRSGQFDFRVVGKLVCIFATIAYSPQGNGPQKWSSSTTSHHSCGIFRLSWEPVCCYRTAKEVLYHIPDLNILRGKQYLFRIIVFGVILPRKPCLCAMLIIFFQSEMH